jgi:hypothetical protein
VTSAASGESVAGLPAAESGAARHATGGVRGWLRTPEDQPLAGFELLVIPPREKSPPSSSIDHGVPDLFVRRALANPSLEARAGAVGARPFSISSERDGSFTPPIGDDGWALESADPAYALVANGWASSAGEPCRYVVVPAIEVRGQVVDAAGRAIAGAHAIVEARLDDMHDARFTLSGGRGWRTWDAVTDEHGEFVFRSVAAPVGQTLLVRALGFVERRVPLRDPDRATLRVELSPTDVTSPLEIKGVVVDQNGRAVQGADVIVSSAATRAGEDGRFALTIDRKQKSLLVGLLAPGRQAAEHTFPMVDLEAAMKSHRDVELRVGAVARKLIFDVFDERNRPYASCRVDVLDPESARSYEKYRNGDELLSDAAGHVVIDGLDARSYRVSFIDARTGVRWVEGPFEAQVAEAAQSRPVRAARTEKLDALYGRIVGPAGEPLAGVAVSLLVESAEIRKALDVLTLSDARGEFELHDVAANDVKLVFASPFLVQPPRHSPALETSPAHPMIVSMKSVRARFRVAVAADDRATAFELQETNGDPIPVTPLGGNEKLSRVRRDPGVEFPACVCRSGPAVLVLLERDLELRRQTVDLAPVKVNRIDVPVLAKPDRPDSKPR